MNSVRPTAPRRGPLVAAATAALLFAVAACGEDPVEVEFQVIEEAQFDPSLNVDLSLMERQNNGVYRRDITVGTGDTLVFGFRARVDHRGWLIDGTLFSQGEFDFLMGNNEVIRGFEDGLVGMLEGGTRQLIIPPEAGYGAAGNGPVPPGAIMVFEVDLIDVF